MDAFGFEVFLLPVQWYCLAELLINNMSEEFRRTIASRYHKLRMFRTSDIAWFCTYFRSCTALDTLVYFYYVTADMKFSRSVYQFIVFITFGIVFFM